MGSTGSPSRPGWVRRGESCGPSAGVLASVGAGQPGQKRNDACIRRRGESATLNVLVLTWRARCEVAHRPLWLGSEDSHSEAPLLVVVVLAFDDRTRPLDNPGVGARSVCPSRRTV